MGRVRRYKKVKSMDPFAKGGASKKGRKREDLDRNLPPDVKNHQAQRLDNLQQDGKNKKKLKRRLPRWAQEEVKDTAKRVREEHEDPHGRARQPEPERPTIEGKRDDETVRQFKTRVREGTAQLLRDSSKEHSATNKKRKKYLEERKLKNKLKKQGRWEEMKRRRIMDEEGEAEEERAKAAASAGPKRWGRQAGGGRGSEASLRLGAPGRWDDEEGANFPGTERIRFGELAHAPPDLTKIPKPRGFAGQGQAKPWARHSTVGDGHRDGRQPSCRKAGEQHVDRAAMGRGGAVQKGRPQQDRENKDAQKAQKRQMEEMRKRVQEAYSGLKNKRRAGQTQYVGSDL